MTDQTSELLLEHARWVCNDYVGRMESANQRIAITLGIAVTLGTVVIAIGMSNATGWLMSAYLLSGFLFAVPAWLAFKALQPVSGNDVSHLEIARVQEHIAQWPDASVSHALLNTLTKNPETDEHQSVMAHLSEVKSAKFEQQERVVASLFAAALSSPVILGVAYAAQSGVFI